MNLNNVEQIIEEEIVSENEYQDFPTNQLYKSHEKCFDLPVNPYEYLKSPSNEETKIVAYNSEAYDDDSISEDRQMSSQLPIHSILDLANHKITKRRYLKRKIDCRNNCRRQLCRRSIQSAKLVRMQIEVLKAKKQKLLEETHILRLTKQKLITELAQMRKDAA